MYVLIHQEKTKSEKCSFFTKKDTRVMSLDIVLMSQSPLLALVVFGYVFLWDNCYNVYNSGGSLVKFYVCQVSLILTFGNSLTLLHTTNILNSNPVIPPKTDTMPYHPIIFIFNATMGLTLPWLLTIMLSVKDSFL